MDSAVGFWDGPQTPQVPTNNRDLMEMALNFRGEMVQAQVMLELEADSQLSKAQEQDWADI